MAGWTGSGAEPVSCSGGWVGGGEWSSRRSARNHKGKKGQKCHQCNIQYLELALLVEAKLNGIKRFGHTPKMLPFWRIWHFLPFFVFVFKHKSLADVGSLCIGLSFTIRFPAFTRTPWLWRWRGPGTYPFRRCCAGWCPLPCTPPPAPCCSPPWWAPVSQPPEAERNSPASVKREPSVNKASVWGCWRTWSDWGWILTWAFLP